MLMKGEQEAVQIETSESRGMKRIKRQSIDLFIAGVLIIHPGRVFVVRAGQEEVNEVLCLSTKIRNST